ncbi:hypothetical protein Ait01nite_091220 [Actinoplanes italicus]|nr:hypothetical protein Ait01nite_091220 [Actinoplanes italicus]
MFDRDQLGIADRRHQYQIRGSFNNDRLECRIAEMPQQDQGRTVILELEIRPHLWCRITPIDREVDEALRPASHTLRSRLVTHIVHR